MDQFKKILLLCVVPALAAPTTSTSPLTYLETQQVACGIPIGYSPPTVLKLPDPFINASGQNVTTLEAWKCRQQELSAIFQRDEFGTIPPKPSTFSASLSGSTLTINTGEAGKTMSFSVSIKKPSSSGPFPAIIALGGASIPIPSNVATITFNNDQMAAQSGIASRGQGQFYNLYGSAHSAGATAGWAWGISRIIDALETIPAASIDTTRIGITGCSRNGKGAFVAGAFDSRITLTIPQESGAGGAACWRVSDAEKRAGKNVQTARQIVGENPWFGTSFERFVGDTARLPHDHHELAALVAPRGLYVLENDIDWLGPVSTNVCMRVGRMVYRAVGAPDNMGFSQAAAHGHCQFPSSQQGELAAFIDRFLLGGLSSTADIEKGTVGADVASWVDWTPPILS